MSRAPAPKSLWIIALLALLVPATPRAQFIDFETLPGGTPTVDQQLISTEYNALGVTFSLLDPVSGLPIGSPRIARAGLPQTAFEGCYAADTPYGYLGLGQSFLTDGTSLGVEGDLRIEYATPVTQASGLILDIDCRTAGGPPCEQWTITAYDAVGTVLDVEILDAPQGAVNPQCASPQAGPGDSDAFGWTVTAAGPQIKSIVLHYTGTAPNVGLAFDNFTVSGPPGPLDVMAAASVDTVCAGESITLTAFPTGGKPPYTFQWQQELVPSWFNLGTGGTQDVQVLQTTRFRVIVTDANASQVTSAPVTVSAQGGVLCSASLLLSNNGGDNLIRYSFLSQQPEVFVPAGSGGLNGPSKLVCGPDGNIYVSSQNNDRVLQYDGVTGAFMSTFVPASSGGLDGPVGIDFGPDGNLYVVSFVLNAVLRYNGTTGAFIDTFVPNGSGLNTPTGMIFGPDDNLYVSSRDGHKVLRFNGTTGAALGDFVTAASGGLNAPRGLVFGPDGNLYVCEEINDSVRRYNGSTGAFIDVFIAGGSGGLDRANDIAFGPDGVCYVASFNNDKLLAYDGGTGAFLGALPDGILNGPAWIAIGCHPRATGVGGGAAAPRPQLSVEPNVPNPFNPWTTVAFTLPAAGPARVTVVDVTGRVIATLLDKSLAAGRHEVEWKGATSAGTPASSGVYFVRVESGGASAAGKMILLR